MFLHGHFDYRMYRDFFHHLSVELSSSPSPPVIGTDDEKAMRKAIHQAFPNSANIVCVRHLRNDVIDHLRDKIGAETGTRSAIVQQH